MYLSYYFSQVFKDSDRHQDLLKHYFDSFHEKLEDKCKKSGRAYATDLFSWEEFTEEWNVEFLDYFKTALPQLLKGLTPEQAKANRKYGWLTHEFDERATLWFCRTALSCVDTLNFS